jgi:hypothetical protein
MTIKLAPKNADAYFNRGNTKRTIGDNKGADFDFKMYFEISAKSN